MEIVLQPHRVYAVANLMTANPKKCSLGQTEAQYLGYQNSYGLLNPQENKVEAMQIFPQPSCETQVWTFLGLTGYNPHFILHFSSIASPLSHLKVKKILNE